MAELTSTPTVKPSPRPHRHCSVCLGPIDEARQPSSPTVCFVVEPLCGHTGPPPKALCHYCFLILVVVPLLYLDIFFFFFVGAGGNNEKEDFVLNNTDAFAPGNSKRRKVGPASASPTASASAAAPVVVSGNSCAELCESHHLPLDVFCQTDGTFICSRCIVFSSHKGHNAVSLEDMSYNSRPTPKEFLNQLSILEGRLDSLSIDIKSEADKKKMFEETIKKGFSDLIAQLQRRLNELLSTAEAIASSKAAALSKQLEIVSAARGHIDKYKSRCITTLENCRGQQIFDCVRPFLEYSRTWTRTSDLESFKENIPHLCFISSGPVLESIKEEAPQTPWTKRAVITLCGQWLPTATKEDICVRVCESVCKNVNIVTPGSVLTFTVPNNGVGRDQPVSLFVFGKPADSSTAVATTQLVGDRVYEWHLSISDLEGACSCVAYGLIQKPFDQNHVSPRNFMYCWSTASQSCNLTPGTPAFKATGGTEEVTLRYDADRLALTATWPLHDNATATVNNIPRGLYPAVNINNHNTVRIS
ncbi:hypothetical protein Pelo_6095 [Pelomyxa schiedti]|nr:hypothetical protein Pelo_6095 [Pelomyxa schiedti]